MRKLERSDVTMVDGSPAVVYRPTGGLNCQVDASRHGVSVGGGWSNSQDPEDLDALQEALAKAALHHGWLARFPGEPPLPEHIVAREVVDTWRAASFMDPEFLDSLHQALPRLLEAADA